MAAFRTLIIVCVAIYTTGVDGGFLFHDWANLRLWAATGQLKTSTPCIDTTPQEGDPRGRPVSMLSVLIDARDWPTDPTPFKRNNIALHALSGVLLYQVLVSLGLHVAQDPRQARFAAVLAAGILLLPPLSLYVLYIVQRHAMPCNFVLGGVRLWIASDKSFQLGRTLPWVGPYCVCATGSSPAKGFGKMNGSDWNQCCWRNWRGCLFLINRALRCCSGT